MTLAQLATLIEAFSAFTLTSLHSTADRFTATIGAPLPDGQVAANTIVFSRAELHDARFPEQLVEHHVEESNAVMTRYIASFVATPAPKWDEMRWG